jgi:signal transduction histidine kinase
MTDYTTNANRLKLFFKGQYTTLTGFSMVCLANFFIVFTQENKTQTTVWIIFLLAALMPRFLLVKKALDRIEKDDMEADELFWYEKAYGISSGLTSLISAAGIFYFFPVQSMPKVFILGILVAGQTAGALGSTGISIFSYRVFSTPIIVGFGISLIYHFQAMEYTLLAVMLVIYLGVLWNISKQLYDFTMKTFVLQQDLVDTAKLAALGEVSSGIAHEINNPLTIVQGNAKKLLRLAQKGDLDQEVMINSLNKIDVSINRAAKIVHSLRSLSSFGHEDAKQVLEVKEMITDIRSIVGKKFEVDGIDLSFNLPQDELYTHGTEVYVAQIIINLLNNARDALLETGQDEKKIDLNVEDDGGTIKFKVSDNGPGIPEEIRKKIMEPFFTTKEVSKGSGLGLSLCNKYANLNDGKLYLDEQQSQTTFVLELPKTELQ